MMMLQVVMISRPIHSQRELVDIGSLIQASVLLHSSTVDRSKSPLGILTTYVEVLPKSHKMEALGFNVRIITSLCAPCLCAEALVYSVDHHRCLLDTWKE